MSTEPAGGATEPLLSTTVTYLRWLVYGLGSLLALALLVVGTIAVIAEVKGTWHWAVHLESTISYVGAFVGVVLVALVPATALLYVVRWVDARSG